MRLDHGKGVVITVACARMPLDAARDAMIAAQARVIEVLAAGNARLAGQVTDLAARAEQRRTQRT